MSANDAEEQALEERREKEWEMRVRGKSYREIGAAFGISHVTAYHDIQGLLERRRAETNESIDNHRAAQLGRLDKAIAVLMPMVEDPDTALQAMDRLDKLERRRAELLGLDAPERHAHEVLAGVTSPTEAAKLVREAFGAKATPKPDGA